MRINVYAEELTDRVEVVEKTVNEKLFIGLRFYLELPVSTPSGTVRGPFQHGLDDDGSAAVTFWANDHRALSDLLSAGLLALGKHHREVVG